MTTTSFFSFFRLRPGTAHLKAILGLAGLATPLAAHAAPPATVDPADTYSIELVGYNLTDPTSDVYVIRPGLMPTFGTTQTFTGDTIDGSLLTTTSSETVSNGTTTDTITISVPTNFVPAGTTDNKGNIINALTFSIGLYQGGTNALDFDLALGNPNSSGSAGIHPTGMMASVVPIPQQNQALSNGDKSYSNEEGVFIDPASMTSITFDDVTSFTITVTNVPEPSTVTALGVGAAGLLWMAARRRAARV